MPAAGGGTQVLILLAERDTYAAEFAEFFLKTEGFEVVLALDATDAVLALGRELAVEPDRGVAVREEPPADGDDTPVDGEFAEGLKIHGREPYRCSASRMSSSKQVRAPVWQAAPVWSTRTRTVSPSQSRATDLTCWMWPEVSPLTQYSCLLRDQ